MPNRERYILYKNEFYTLRELSELTGLSRTCIIKRCDAWGEVDMVVETAKIRDKYKYKKKKKKKEQKVDLFMQMNRLMRPCSTV